MTLFVGLLLLGSRQLTEMVDIAGSAEAMGLDDVWVPDERFFRDTYVAGTMIAAATKRISIGPCVTDPHMRHAIVTAAALASLDEVSEGRAVLGIGAGISGYAEVGMKRPVSAPQAVEDTIQVVRGLIAGDSISGGATLEIEPTRSRVPVHVAAEGPHMARLAGRIGDGGVLQATAHPAVFADLAAEVIDGAESAGRSRQDIEITVRVDMAIANTLNEARDRLRLVAVRRLHSPIRRRRLTAAGIKISGRLDKLITSLGYTHDPASLQTAAREIDNETVDALTLAVTPDTLARRLDSMASWGVDRLLINPVTPNGIFGIRATIAQLAEWRRTRVTTDHRRELSSRIEGSGYDPHRS